MHCGNKNERAQVNNLFLWLLLNQDAKILEVNARI